MTQPDRSAVAGMSIGAVFDLLRPDFPDVTISKIRFLEEQGLVTPERTGSGYRRFTAYDCARLRFILSAQRDQYLPLKVIKAQLDAQADGVNQSMLLAAAKALAEVVTDGELGPNYIVPSVFHPDVTTRVAGAVREAAGGRPRTEA